MQSPGLTTACAAACAAFGLDTTGNAETLAQRIGVHIAERLFADVAMPRLVRVVLRLIDEERSTRTGERFVVANLDMRICERVLEFGVAQHGEAGGRLRKRRLVKLMDKGQITCA